MCWLTLRLPILVNQVVAIGYLFVKPLRCVIGYAVCVDRSSGRLVSPSSEHCTTSRYFTPDSQIAPEAGGRVVLRVNRYRHLTRQHFTVGHGVGHMLTKRKAYATIRQLPTQ